MEYADVNEYWYRNDQKCREDGLAMELANGIVMIKNAERMNLLSNIPMATKTNGFVMRRSVRKPCREDDSKFKNDFLMEHTSRK